MQALTPRSRDTDMDGHLLPWDLEIFPVQSGAAGALQSMTGRLRRAGPGATNMHRHVLQQTVYLRHEFVFMKQCIVSSPLPQLERIGR